MPPIVTILVNWRAYYDTIECLESLYRSDYPDQRVVVVDNGSRDGSLSKLLAWATGRSSALPNAETLNLRYKTIRVATLTADDVLNGRRGVSEANLFLVDAGTNRGFAGGVNIGLKLALTLDAVQYMWVLNNDTVVAPDCLRLMQRRIQENPCAGMCGCRILFYHQPERVQVLAGARFNPWFGASYLIGTDQLASQAVNIGEIERELGHLSGASMLVSKEFVQEIGFMDESYFLYYEEADWAVRSKGRYRLVYADSAVVYHKEGASIGSSHRPEYRSSLSAYFLIRSRLRFTRKFYWWAMPTVLGYSFFQALKAYFNDHPEQARAMLCALRGLSAKEAIGWTPDS